ARSARGVGAFRTWICRLPRPKTSGVLRPCALESGRKAQRPYRPWEDPMKRSYGLTVLFSTLPLALASVPLAAGEPAQPAYVVYDTGTLGGSIGFGSGINELGWISGASTDAAGELHAALWSPGRVIDLGTLGGTNSAVEWPVKNNHGL